MKDNAVELFFETYMGNKADEILALPQSGSSRINYIVQYKEEKFVITSNDNLLENEAFLYFSDVFSALQLNTPHILSVSENRKMYLQDFVGQETLSEIIANDGIDFRVKNLVKQTLEKLHFLQISTEDKVDYQKTFEYEAYDELPIRNDLFYFKNMFVDVLELAYHKATLLREFENLVKIVENLTPKTIMTRDFQARNIMVNEDEVFFIDYQSAMKGPAMYDIVSFLFQAKANFTEDFKAEMVQYYLNLWQSPELENQLLDSLKPIQLIRYLQVLGAYGFRGLIQRKQHFISSIDQGIDNLYQLANTWKEMENYPELKNLILSLKSDEVKGKIEKMLFKH